MNRQMSKQQLIEAADELTRRAFSGDRAQLEALGALDAPALLMAASRLVTRALGAMDLRSVGCECCGRRTYLNRRDSKAAEKLAAQAESLRRASERLASDDEEA